MAEILLACLIAAANYFIDNLIKKKANRYEDKQSIIYLLKWKGLRIFGLIAGLLSVILWAGIDPYLFVLAFTIVYFTSLFYAAIRYDAN